MFAKTEWGGARSPTPAVPVRHAQIPLAPNPARLSAKIAQPLSRLRSGILLSASASAN